MLRNWIVNALLSRHSHHWRSYPAGGKAGPGSYGTSITLDV